LTLVEEVFPDRQIVQKMHELSEKETGVLRVLGQRRLAIDVQTLCDHLDLLVGSKVAEVIIGNTSFALGKEDVSRVLKERPDATILEMIEFFVQDQRLSGVGICKVNVRSEKSVDLEIINPVLKPTSGSSKAMVVSRWCGALSELLNEKMIAEKVEYDEISDVLKCRIVASIIGKKIEA
jgi:hypothetical protein